MKAEFAFDCDEPRMYLNLFLCPVESESEDQTILVHYRFNETEYEAEAYVMRGGQRLLMPSEACCRITDALCNGFNIDIAVADYCTKLEPMNFQLLMESL